MGWGLGCGWMWRPVTVGKEVARQHRRAQVGLRQGGVVVGLVLRARLLVGESLGPAVDEFEARVARLQQEEAGAELPRARGGTPLRLVRVRDRVRVRFRVRVRVRVRVRARARVGTRYRWP